MLPIIFVSLGFYQRSFILLIPSCSQLLFAKTENFTLTGFFCLFVLGGGFLGANTTLITTGLRKRKQVLIFEI